MAERSLRATSEGIKEAKKRFKNDGWTQTQMGEAIGTTRQPIGKFFAGKPIERPTFIDICRLLSLDWEDIVEPEPEEQNQKNSIDIDVLVQEVREKVKPDIQERCGTMRVLDMSQPIGLKDIYTNVNILEKITGRQRKEIAQLKQECKSEDFERGLGRTKEKRVPGLKAVEKHTKLMIWGKPGAGKTTFLKYLAIQCNRGEFQVGRVPIFVTLKDFAEAAGKPGFLEYLNQQFAGYRLVGARYTVPLPDELLKHGKMLVLLDGLDEVREEDSQRVLKEIRGFSDRFRDNHFVITCRIAAREYTFEKFTEVEVADFDDEQISTFATNWFQGKAVKAENFIQRLKDNNRIQELATNPLLLILLCLAFEESGDFPANRSELYKEGLDALLKKWDAKRGIYRNQVYKKLSPQRKEDLLSKIGLITFDRGDYFFKQKTAEQYIADYIRNLPDANTDPEALQLDSEAVLRSIEAQHGLLVEQAKGIYSFSHLTFHEYFTAREIVIGKQSSEEALQSLVSHITDYRWEEVFLLAVGMSPNANHLLQLMKQQVDTVLADEELQQFLIWANQKSLSVTVPYASLAIRASYLCWEYVHIGLFDSDTYFELADAAGAPDFDSYYPPLKDTLALDKQCYNLLEYEYYDLFFPNEVLASDIENILDYQLEPGLKQILQQLNDELPDPTQDKEKFQGWWRANSHAWCDKLKAPMTKYRNIGHDWQFNDEQKELLEQYYDANLFLLDCLYSDVVVTPEVRQEIEDTLLLPIAEIEKRQQR